jgi:3-hydroxybutyryl-CoA dehydrogenase
MKARRVVVAGTGTMGPGIAEVFALASCEVALWGRREESVRRGLERARCAGASLERLGRIPAGRADEAAERLTGGTDLEAAAADADFLVETIVEDLAAKQDCFRRLDRAAPDAALLVSNTSGLPITEMASATGRPERVAGMHWWNPPHLIPLVEIVCGDRTSEETADAVAAVARDLGKLPVTVRKDVPGFLGNRLQYALLREAARLVEEGVASAEDVDRAMRAGPGLRWAALGPLEVADFIGLDVVAGVMDYLLPELHPGLTTPAGLAEMAAAGRHGLKTGAGFYDYSGRPADGMLAERDAKLARLLDAGFGA